MINPFTSSHQNYLFRKNYQFISKNNQPKPTHNSIDTSSSKLSQLQYNNPFKNQNNILKISPNHNKTSRTLSTSRVGSINNNQSRLGIGKNKLLDGDRWKKQLQKGQRQKLQYYGAQGLRYNSQAYNPMTKYYSQQKLKPSQYSPSTNYKPNKYKHQQRDYIRQYDNPIRKQTSQQYYLQRQKTNSYQSKKTPKNNKNVNLNTNTNVISSYHDYYVVQPKSQRQKDKKYKRQSFQDEFQQDLINQIDKKHYKKQQKQKSSKHHVFDEHQHEQQQSKLVDMFGSSYDDRFKNNNGLNPHGYRESNYNGYNKFRQSSNYNSYNTKGTKINALDLYDSKNSNKMRDSKYMTNQRRQINHRFYESDVRQVIPKSIEIDNVMYYHIQLS